MALATGAIGGMAMASDAYPIAYSRAIAENICAELANCDKVQRNTQSELLAILVMLRTAPEYFRGGEPGPL